MCRVITGIFLAVCMFATAVAADLQGGVMNADSKAQQEAKADATVTGQLAKGTEVKILERSGGWMKVQGSGVTGWVKALTVKRDGKGVGLTDVASVVSGRGATGKVVSTSGTRGLDAETLKAAKFNKSELDTMETQKADKKDAEQFAQAVDLKAMKLAYPEN